MLVMAGSEAAGAALSAIGRRRQSDQVQNAVLPHSGDPRIGEDNRKLALVLRIAVAGKKAAALEALDLLRR